MIRPAGGPRPVGAPGPHRPTPASASIAPGLAAARPAVDLEQVRARLAHARAVTQAVFELMAAAREATAELPSAARLRGTGAPGHGRIEAARAEGRGTAGRETAFTGHERTRALREQRARLRRLLGDGHRPLLEPARKERGSGDLEGAAAERPDAREGAAPPWLIEARGADLARAQGSVPAAEALRLLRPEAAASRVPEGVRARRPGPQSPHRDSPGARVE